MFIIYGTKSFDKTLGNLGIINRCEHCNNDIHFKVFRRMNWFTLFWIPIFPVSRKYYITCPICNYGKKLKKAEAMEILEKYNSSVLTEHENG